MRIFDGHNDMLQRVVAAGASGPDLFLRGDGAGHLDLPRMRAGGFAGGFFAIWIPERWYAAAGGVVPPADIPPYAHALPAEIGHDAALPQAFAQAAALFSLERTGALSICRTAEDLRAAMDAGRIAAILHMEGAEAVRDPDALTVWHAMGLRSLGPVWSRPTRYGHGVPFAFPSSPDTGEGLTPAGIALVRACNTLRIMVDLSHLNEKGFEDVARISDAPLVASHSAVHAIAPSSRNLTDRQLRQIAESGGLVGLNFAISFLRPDGHRIAAPGIDLMLRHLDHLLGLLGEGGVALGADFDGALLPSDLPHAGALPALVDAMRRRGYADELLERICWRNWVGVLERTWDGAREDRILPGAMKGAGVTQQGRGAE
ncbi:membrane dipeptidase [uncultured Paracoccus sp.]|uniref:dipeptidase n=1 Tax=uncultured Paracoccus sp. TaxID=189685 RepID=UPI002617EF31|nr:membrane dipeptidase [uncultured Paracoccus sp.]